MVRRVVTSVLDTCPVCACANRQLVLDLPSLPLTGIFVENARITLPSPHQGLMLCEDCGHGYLTNVVDPVLLYQETYSHRSGGSGIARAGNDFLWNYIQSFIGDRRVRTVLEIGCNDLYLMSRLQGIAETAVGLDPIWEDRRPDIPWSHVQVLGTFVANLTAADVPAPPDLIVSAHTFEHVADPRVQLESLVEIAADGAIFVIEVPCFDTQMSNFRFDQVFHQHIQYFSVASVKRLIEELNCGYLHHTFNYRYWGGTLLVAFTKGPARRLLAADRMTAPDVRERVEVFKTRYAVLRRELEEWDAPIYAFGAAQMLPVVAYHLGTDMSGFTAILDDNPDRVGRFFPGWPTPIRAPSSVTDVSDAAIMMTALDSYRAILQRVLELDPRAIFYPVCKM